jgi:hypothetical protein
VIATLVLVGLFAAAWVLALCLSRARRLHRLHLRVDAARAGLDAALARRAVAAAQAGVAIPDGPTTQASPCPHNRPDAGAGTALPVPSPLDREAAANALGRALVRLERTALPPDVRAALADAEQLLVLARRVYNDAVRDTLGLRSRRLVRWLRLAGTAPMPAYFEIADPPPALTYDRVSPSQD